MATNPALIAETRAWLEKAKEDLDAANLLLSSSPPYLSLAAFHAQQGAEKAQKASLTWHARPLGKTHDLGVLGGECTAIDPTLNAVASAVAPVSGYAVEARYPGPWSEPNPSEAREAINLAQNMYDAVVARLAILLTP